MTAQDLPSVNAFLNSISALFLVLGFIAIKSGNRKRHARMMMCALATSLAFLISYLYYHFSVRLVTHYQGQGILRGIYFFVLGTHTPLAALVAPASLVAIWFAIRKQFEKHKRVTRWLWPVWLYVNVTGVLIYLMLYVF